MLEKILIVDDSPIARKILKSCIPDKERFTIIEAKNGKEGLDLYLSEKPNMVFMDLTMPIMDGYEALSHIKEHDRNAIVVVLTADIQAKSIARIVSKGAYKLTKKPATKESISAIIDEITEQLSEG